MHSGRLAGFMFVFDVALFLILLSIFATFSNETLDIYSQNANLSPSENTTISQQDATQINWNADNAPEQPQGEGPPQALYADIGEMGNQSDSNSSSMYVSIETIATTPTGLENAAMNPTEPSGNETETTPQLPPTLENVTGSASQVIEEGVSEPVPQENATEPSNQTTELPEQENQTTTPSSADNQTNAPETNASSNQTTTQTDIENLVNESEIASQNQTVNPENNSILIDIENLTNGTENLTIGLANETQINWGLNQTLNETLNETIPPDLNLTENLTENLTNETNKTMLAASQKPKYIEYTEVVEDGFKTISGGGFTVSTPYETDCLIGNPCAIAIDITSNMNYSYDLTVGKIQLSDDKLLEKEEWFTGKNDKNNSNIWMKDKLEESDTTDFKNKKGDVVHFEPYETKTIILKAKFKNVAGPINWSVDFKTPDGWMNLDPIVDISDCANLNTAGTTYNLTGTASGNQSDGYCIHITASDITLLCNGFSIIGPGDGGGTTVGIYATKVKNITITGAGSSIYGYMVNILFNKVNDSTIDNVDDYIAYNTTSMGSGDPGGYGVEVVSSKNISITNSKFRGNYAMNAVIGASQDVSIDNSVFTYYSASYHSFVGIYDLGSQRTIINNSGVYGHDWYGYLGDTSSSPTIDHSTFGNSTKAANYGTNAISIMLSFTPYARITNNKFNYPSVVTYPTLVEAHAIDLDHSNSSYIFNNSINNAYDSTTPANAAVLVEYSGNETIANNSFSETTNLPFTYLDFEHHYGGNLIQNNSFVNAERQYLFLYYKEDSVTDIIDNNLFGTISYDSSSSMAGIELTRTSYVNISRNLFGDPSGTVVSPGTAIYIDVLNRGVSDSSNNILVFNNQIYYVDNRTTNSYYSAAMYIDNGDGLPFRGQIYNNKIYNVSAIFRSRWYPYPPIYGTLSTYGIYGTFANASIVNNTINEVVYGYGIYAKSYAPESQSTNLTIANNTIGTIYDTGPSIGIFLENVSNSSIDHNTLENFTDPEAGIGVLYGIYCTWCQGTNITNNQMHNIDLYHSDEGIAVLVDRDVITGNNASDVNIWSNNVSGVHTMVYLSDYAQRISIWNNTLHNYSTYGVFTQKSNNITIDSNNFTLGEETGSYGVYSPLSSYSYGNWIFITNNNFTQFAKGIELDGGHLQLYIGDNRLVGPFGYGIRLNDMNWGYSLYAYRNYINGTYEPDSIDFYASNITGLFVFLNNLTASDDNLVKVRDADYLIFSYNRLFDGGASSFSKASVGITSSNITNNSFYNTSQLWISGSDYVNITDNTMNYTDGIWITNSSNMNIQFNNLTSMRNISAGSNYTYPGINTTGAIIYMVPPLSNIYPCSNFVISDNLISGGSTYGMAMYNSSTFTIANNTVNDIRYYRPGTSGTGIFVKTSKDMIFVNNSANSNAIGFDIDNQNIGTCEFSNNSANNNRYSSLGTGFYLNSTCNFTNNTADNNILGLHPGPGSSNSNFLNTNLTNDDTGIYIDYYADNLTITNTIIGNSSFGFELLDSNNTQIDNMHIFNSSILDMIAERSSRPGFGQVNISRLIIDNPYGDFRNFTNLSINDNIGHGDDFSLLWTIFTPFNHYLPNGRGSFQEKYVNLSGTGSIDNISWYWNDDEFIPPQSENYLELWKYNVVSGWSKLNDTPDTTNNVITQLNLNPASTYALLTKDNCLSITTPGTTYVMEHNFTGSPIYVSSLTSIVPNPYTCVYINASDVTLDCNGSWIKGNNNSVDDIGIVIDPPVADNVNITNCTIYNYTYAGVISFGSQNSNFTNNIVDKIGQYSMMSFAADNNRFINNLIGDCGDTGIMVLDSDDNYISGNQIGSCTGSGGITVMKYGVITPSHNVIFNNLIIDSVEGIFLYKAHGTNVSNNLLYSNGDGIAAQQGSYNNATNNQLFLNTGNGLYMVQESHGYNANNNISYNSIGITDARTSNESYFNNSISSSTSFGIYIASSADAAFEQDHVFNSTSADLIVDANTLALPVSYRATHLVLDNPEGNYVNFSNISIVDTSSAGNTYVVSWVSNPGILPTSRESFADKFVGMITAHGSPTIDTFIYHWRDDEISSELEPRIELWKMPLAGPAWNLLNNTPDIIDNNISYYGTSPSGFYGLFYPQNCPVISENQTYTLSRNLYGAPNDITTDIGTSASACVRINSSDVILDCNGFNITDNGTTGVVGTVGVFVGLGVSNVTVKNCNISNYSIAGIGVVESGANISGNSIHNISGAGGIFGGLGGGILLEYHSSQNNITNNSIYDSIEGVWLWGSSSNNISGNNIYGNLRNQTTGLGGVGVHSLELPGLGIPSQTNTIENNNITSNQRAGIYFQSSTSGHNTVNFNNFTSNTMGVFINSTNNDITNNIASLSNTAFSVGSSAAQYNNFTNNTADSQSAGFNVQGPYNVFNDNVVSNSTSMAFRVTGTSAMYNNFTNNTVWNNTFGFGVSSTPTYNRFVNNTVLNGTGYGFYCAGGYNTFINSTVHDVIDDGSGNYGQGFYLTSVASSNNVIQNSVIYNNVYGVMMAGSPFGNTFEYGQVYNNDFGVLLDVAGDGNIIRHSNISSNNMVGIYVLDTFGTPTQTVINNNTIANEPYGIGINGSREVHTLDNIIANNTINGTYVENTLDLTSARDHYSNNTVDFLIYTPGPASQSRYKFETVIFDSPYGNLTNFTNLSVIDVVPGPSGYFINWSAQPATMPNPSEASFDGKFINITNFTGTVSIDNITWHWTDAEVTAGGYDDNLFELWKYNSTWKPVLGATIDTAANTYNKVNLVPQTVYGILIGTNCPIIETPGTYDIGRNQIGAPNNVTGEVSIANVSVCIKVGASDVIVECDGYNVTGDGTGSLFLPGYATSLDPLHDEVSGRDFADGVLYVVAAGSPIQITADGTDLTPGGVNGIINIDVALLDFGVVMGNQTWYYDREILGPGPPLTCTDWENNICGQPWSGLPPCTCHYAGSAWDNNGAGNNYTWVTNPANATIVPTYTDPPYLRYGVPDDDTAGIFLNASATNVTVKDCTVSKYSLAGIALWGASNANNMTSNTVYDIDNAKPAVGNSYGIMLIVNPATGIPAENNTVENNVIYSIGGNTPGAGIGAFTANYNNITNNDLTNCQDSGIFLYNPFGAGGSTHNRIIGNNATGTAGFGTLIGPGCDYNVLIGNNMSGNIGGGAESGIGIQSSYNNITSNSANNNNNMGIYVGNSLQNNLTDNNATANGDRGIYFTNASESIISGGNISANNGNGIYMRSGSNSNNITNVISSNNSNDGIQSDQSNLNSFTNNNVTANGENGLNIYRSNYCSVTGGNYSSNMNRNGIYAQGYSNYTNITGTYVSNNSGTGIAVGPGDYGWIVGNTVELQDNSTGIGIGISVSQSNYSVIENNTVSRSVWGIYTLYANHTLITGNNLTHQQSGDPLVGTISIYISRSTNQTVTYNNVSWNGDNFNSTIGIAIGGDNDSLVAFNNVTDNCFGNGILSWYTNNNVNITDNRISGLNPCTGGGLGITLNSYTNSTIERNNVTDSWQGILVDAYSSNLYIQDNNVTKSSGQGLQAQNSNNLYIYRNNISGNNLAANTNGIYFSYNVIDSVIENNTVSHNTGYGVLLWNSSSNNITNNTVVSNTFRGFVLSEGSNSNWLENNTAISNPQTGFRVDNSSDNILNNNSASFVTYANEYGFEITGPASTGNQIKNSIAFNNTNGFGFLDYATLNTISHVYSYNNTNNGVTYGLGTYLINTLRHSNITENRYGVNIYHSANGLIYNNSITRNPYGGIYSDSTDKFNITENYIENASVGIQLTTGHNDTVFNNTITNISYEGISLASGENETLGSNTIHFVDKGIMLDSGTLYTLMENNTIFNATTHGISVLSSSNNTGNNNTIYDSGKGIYVSGSNYNLFRNNAINNTNYGAQFDTAYYNTFDSNNVTYSSTYGVLVYGSSYSLITNNTLDQSSDRSPSIPYFVQYTNGIWYPDSPYTNSSPTTAYNQTEIFLYGTGGFLNVTQYMDISITGYNGTQDLTRVLFFNMSNLGIGDNKYGVAYFNVTNITDCNSFKSYMANLSNNVTSCDFYQPRGFISNGYGNAYYFDSFYLWTDITGLNPVNSYAAITVTYNGNGNLVYNNTITNSYMQGIYIGQDPVPPYNNNVTANKVLYTRLDGIRLQSIDNVRVDQNYVSNITEIGSSCINEGNIRNSVITYNNVTNCSNNGIWMCDGNNLETSFNNVNNSPSGSMLMACGLTYSNVSYNNLTNNGGGIGIDWIENTYITNNIIENLGGHGINFYTLYWEYLSIPLHTSQNVAITDNRICNNAGTGIDIEPTRPADNEFDYAHDIAIKRNVICNNEDNGITVSYFHKDIGIENNTISSNDGNGVQFIDMNNESNHILLNTISDNTGFGILLSNVSVPDEDFVAMVNNIYGNTYGGLLVSGSTNISTLFNYYHDNLGAGGILVSNSNTTQIIDGASDSNSIGLTVTASSNTNVLGGDGTFTVYYISQSPLNYGGQDFPTVYYYSGLPSASPVNAFWGYFPLFDLDNGEFQLTGGENVSVVLLNMNGPQFDNVNTTFYFNATTGWDCSNFIDPNPLTGVCANHSLTCACLYYNETAFQTNGMGKDYTWMLTNGGDPTVMAGYTSQPFVSAGMKFYNNGIPALHYMSSYDPLRNSLGMDFDTSVVYLGSSGGLFSFTPPGDTDLSTQGVDGSFDIDVALLNFSGGQGGGGNQTWYYNTNFGPQLVGHALTCWDWENVICNNTGTSPYLNNNCTCSYAGSAWQNNGAGNNYTWVTPPASATIVPGNPDPPHLNATPGSAEKIVYFTSMDPLKDSATGINFTDVLYLGIRDNSVTITSDYTDLTSIGLVDGSFDIDVALLDLTTDNGAINGTLYYDTNLGSNFGFPSGYTMNCNDWETVACPGLDISCTCYFAGNAWQNNGAGNDYSWMVAPANATIMPGNTYPPFLQAISMSAVNAVDSDAVTIAYVNVTKSQISGVSAIGDTNLQFIYSNVLDNPEHGILVKSSATSNFIGNVVRNTGNYGYVVYSSTQTTIDSSEISDDVSGIYAESSYLSVISNNTIFNNSIAFTPTGVLHYYTSLDPLHDPGSGYDFNDRVIYVDPDSGPVLISADNTDLLPHGVDGNIDIDVALIEFSSGPFIGNTTWYYDRNILLPPPLTPPYTCADWDTPVTGICASQMGVPCTCYNTSNAWNNGGGPGMNYTWQLSGPGQLSIVTPGYTDPPYLNAVNVTSTNPNAGIALYDSNRTTLADNYLFNNSVEFRIAADAGALIVNISNMTIDNPADSLINYTSFSLNDTVDANTGYYIIWALEPTSPPRPHMTRSFQGKFIDIVNETGVVTIDAATWHWLASEEPGYDPNKFALYKVNGTWNRMNLSANVASREISLYSFLVGGDVFGILQDEMLNCPIINESGSYEQPKNYSGAPNNASPVTGYACVKIVASNVSFNGVGFNISDNGTAGDTYGVEINGSLTNITVNGCGISRYSYGIYSYYSENSSIVNNTVLNSYGIFLQNSNYHIIENNSVSSQNINYYLSFSSNNNLTNNTGNGSYTSFYDIGTTNNRYINNLAGNSSSSGFSISNYEDVLINNTAYNTPDGFYLYGAYLTTLVNNTAYNASHAGFYLMASSDNVLQNNTAYNLIGGAGISGIGFMLNLSSNNVLNNATAFNISDGSGIAMFTSSNNLVDNSTVYNTSHSTAYGMLNSSRNNITNSVALNNQYGFYLWNSSNNLLANDYTRNNTGAYLSAGFVITTDGSQNSTGNTISNGTATQSDYGFTVLGYSNGNLINASNASSNNESGFAFIELYGRNVLNNSIAAYNNLSGDANISTGVLIRYANTTVVDNLIATNNQRGVQIDEGASLNNITNSNITGIYYGVIIMSSFGYVPVNNTVYNVLIQNITDMQNSADPDMLLGGRGVFVNGTRTSNITLVTTYNTSVLGFSVVDSNGTIISQGNATVSPNGYKVLRSINTTIANSWGYGYSTGTGFTFMSSNGSNVTNNAAYADRYGINVTDSSTSSFTGNTLVSNGRQGLLVVTSQQNNFTANNISANTRDGAQITSSNGSVFSGNNFTNNKRNGANLQSSNSTTFNGNNTFDNNGLEGATGDWAGVYLQNAIYTTVDNNTFLNHVSSDQPAAISNNPGFTTSYEDIKNNRFSSNALGVLLIALANSNISGNTFNSNLADDIAVISGNYVRIENNTITNGGNFVTFGHLDLTDATNSVISGNNLTNNKLNGIYVDITPFVGIPPTNITVANNSIYNVSTIAITINGTSLSNVFGNNISLADTGIYVNQSNSNNITGNLVNNTYSHGIYLKTSSSNILTNNFAYNSSSDCFRIASGSFNALINNTVGDSTSALGFLMDNSPSNNLTNNTAYGTNYGFNLLSSQNTVITNNTARNNNYGFVIVVSPGNNLTNNTIYNNVFTGVYIATLSDRNTLYNNTIYGNNKGIYVGGSNLTNSTYDHLFNNTQADFQILAAADAIIVNITNATFDWPADSQVNYTVLSLNDEVSASTGYSIHWTSEPLVPPKSVFLNSFQGKFINITNDTGPQTIDSAVWHWNEDEEIGYNSFKFMLEKVNTTWNIVNMSPDADTDTLSLTSFDLGYGDTYGIIERLFVNCPIITEQGTFVQEGNHTGAPNEISSLMGYESYACVWIATSNVVFDCNGSKVTGNGTPASFETYGIVINASLTNVTVKNCLVSNYSVGVEEFSSENSTIMNNLVFNNSLYGVATRNANYSNLTNNTALNNTRGFYVFNSNSLNVWLNNITNNSMDGMTMDSASGLNALSDNYMCFNGQTDIFNSNESNNGATDTCDTWTGWVENGHPGCEYACTSLWSRFYGNVTGSMYLTDNDSGKTLYVYHWNASSYNILVSDVDSNINWGQLQAIGRTVNNDTSATDFIELDNALNGTDYADSIVNTYSTDGTLPKETRNYRISNRKISLVPVANSTVQTTPLQTGILWDMSDGGTEYSNAFNQSTVWVVNVNATAPSNGYYDYMAMVPYTLASSEGSTDAVYFYMEMQ